MPLPKQTPWGAADHCTEYLPGFESYETPSHGGMKLDRQRNAKVPDYMRRASGWYEEDCEWCLAAIVFADELRAKFGDRFDCARDTMRGWYPDEYERFFGVTLAEGESATRDRMIQAERHKDSLVTSAAWGDWAEGVPAGMVGVCARIASQPDKPERFFLVPQTEYSARENRLYIGFIIDPTRHTEIPGPDPFTRPIKRA